MEFKAAPCEGADSWKFPVPEALKYCCTAHPNTSNGGGGQNAGPTQVLTTELESVLTRGSYTLYHFDFASVRGGRQAGEGGCAHASKTLFDIPEERF